MTCIVGIEHDGGVTIGADSAASDGWSLRSRADTKLFQNGPYLMGFCGSFRMGQLLRYALAAPALPDDTSDLEEHMVITFVDAVRDCLTAGGVAYSKNGTETGGTFLVGVAGQLFQIEDDYQVARNLSGFDACGSGAEVALGSLHTSDQYDLSATQRITMALKAAADLTAFVSAPFAVKTLR